MLKPNELHIGNKLIVRRLEVLNERHTGSYIYTEFEVFGVLKYPPHDKNKLPVLLYLGNGVIKEHFLNQDILSIPLTPELLERMGCEVKTYDDEDGALVSMQGLFTMQPFYQKDHSLSISHAPKAKKLRYVHEFQNYYQILTGEELTIKETV